MNVGVIRKVKLRKHRKGNVLGMYCWRPCTKVSEPLPTDEGSFVMGRFIWWFGEDTNEEMVQSEGGNVENKSDLYNAPKMFQNFTGGMGITSFWVVFQRNRKAN